MSANKDTYSIQVEDLVLGTGVVTGVSAQPRQRGVWISAGATYLVGGSSLTTGGSFGFFAFNSSDPLLRVEQFRGSFNVVNLGNTHTVKVMRKFTAE
jgi:hypothetical protein